MPHFALHVLLANRVLETEAGGDPRLADSQAVNAYLHGAIGPDMGYFPGGDDLFSATAHLVRSGDLARAMAATAATPEQHAFALGWQTHMLGDVLVHPLINQAAVELLERDRQAATASWQRNAHIRVELGLDAVYIARRPALARTRLRPFFTPRTASWIAAAFDEVHGVGPTPAHLLKSHLQVVRLQQPLLLLGRLIATSRRRGHPLNGLIRHTLLASRRLAAGRLGADSSAAGFLTPVRPAGGVVRTVDAIVEEFPTAFAAFSRLLLEGEMNYCLETGRIAVSCEPSREELDVHGRLDALRHGARPGGQAGARAAA